MTKRNTFSLLPQLRVTRREKKVHFSHICRSLFLWLSDFYDGQAASPLASLSLCENSSFIELLKRRKFDAKLLKEQTIAPPERVFDREVFGRSRVFDWRANSCSILGVNELALERVPFHARSTRRNAQLKGSDENFLMYI